MRNSRDSGSTLPHEGILLRRTNLQRGATLRESCDSTIRTPGTPLRGLAPSAAELVARNIATILLVPAVMLIVVWVVGR
jgi:hypothetical protein